ncbi:reductive dehalogenase [Chloroflexota bacterium]
MEKLKRVDKPTTKITDNIQRFDQREQGFARAARGDFGNLRRTHWSIRAAKDPMFVLFRPMFMGLPPVNVEEPLRFSREFVDGTDTSTTMSYVEASAGHPLLDVSPQRLAIPDDPAVMSRNIKSVGYFLGADVMGVCELPQWALYSHTPEGKPIESNHKYAISVVVDQGYRAVNGSTGHDWIAGSPPQKSYLFSAIIASMLAGYIRKLGYQAHVQHSHDYQVLITPLLLLSGIGEISRAGIVLNPFIGMRFKAAAVTTDLPLEPDKPIDFGLQDFCEKCKKCARECPSKAISTGDKIMHNGYETWEFDYERCTKQRLGNHIGIGCGRCINVCPWNKPVGGIHDFARGMIKHMPFMNRFIAKMDDVFGYGKPNIKDRWQLEL